jgi:HNH endonuclease
MRCLFCKLESAQSRSVEHIIPEALGNIEHVLPRGIVCDNCNNYFARKVEGPLLETPWFRHVRSRQWVQNKRGNVPGMTGLVPGARLKTDLWMDGPNLMFGPRDPKDRLLLEDAILSGRARSVYVPLITAIDEKLMARFMAKVAIEILAQRLMHVEGWQEELLDNPQLDLLRHYARIGDKPSFWPFSRRRIYGEDDLHVDGYQVLHEFSLLYTEAGELYAVLCLFGEEFVINFGGPEIDGYERWLNTHQNRSPLYISDTLPIRSPGNVFMPKVGETLQLYMSQPKSKD